MKTQFRKVHVKLWTCSKFNSNYHFITTLTENQCEIIKIENDIATTQLNNKAATMENIFY